MNCMATKLFGLLWYSQHIELVKKFHIDSNCFFEVIVHKILKKTLDSDIF